MVHVGGERLEPRRCAPTVKMYFAPRQRVTGGLVVAVIFVVRPLAAMSLLADGRDHLQVAGVDVGEGELDIRKLRARPGGPASRRAG